MKELKLTTLHGLATRNGNKGEGRKMGVRIGLAMAATALLGGCINITAPEDPIVIQLDINIRAEVLYRLAEDASNTIDDNDGLF